MNAAEAIVKDAVRSGSDNAFEAAIALCESLEREGGHTPACCARAIRDFKAKVAQPPKVGAVMTDPFQHQLS